MRHLYILVLPSSSFVRHFFVNSTSSKLGGGVNVGRWIQVQYSQSIRFFGCQPVEFQDCSGSLCRHIVPAVLQAHQPLALIEMVTGHEQREASLLGSPPICSYLLLTLLPQHSRTCFRPIPFPITRRWRSDTFRLPCASRKSP